MKKGGRRNLMDDVRKFLKDFFSSRLFVLGLVMFLLFLIILGRVFTLQVVEGETYQNNFELKIQKTLSLNAARGNIYDRNGTLLAGNILAYAITISDSGSYKSTSEKNEKLNAEIAAITNVLHENGETLSNSFAIDYNEEDGTFSFNVSGTKLKRFLADIFGQTSYDDLSYNEELGFDEANATAQQIMDYLRYGTSKTVKYGVSKEYDDRTSYEIVVVRYALDANYYTRYQTSTIAENVSEETVAFINEHSDELIGVSIEEDTIRKYYDSEYFASIIGYTGKISDSEYEELSATDDSYTTNDIIGKAGLEQYYESYLRGQNGEQQIYVNNVGKIVGVISSTDSVAGNDIYITIDSELQKSVYYLLEQEIAGIVYSNIKDGNIQMEDVYFALVDNNVIDITHFADESAAATEQSVYQIFTSAQQSALNRLESELKSEDPLINNDMPEELLDYFTYVISMLKSEKLLLSSEIDTSDSVYENWRNGKISPQEYLQYCISKQWIDISVLEEAEKYSDVSEIYNELCDYILTQSASDKEFSKVVYKYLIADGKVTGRQLCLILFEQGVLDYDDTVYSQISSGDKSASSFLLEKIDNIEITPAQLALEPCTGSCVITDTNTGEILALVSYPGYDNNRLANGMDAAYWESLINDNSNPLYNFATQEKTAPGSTFKMVTATASLAENVISESTTVKCTGIFKEVDNEPKCWIYPGTHGSINVSQAIRDSCNVFFYTMGYKLSQLDTGTYNDANGISYIQKYAALYGLNEKTGLEIQENTPDIATQYPVMAAIGQSNNNLTTVSLSRYVTAVASGNLYNYQLMGSIVDSEGTVVESRDTSYTDISDALPSTQWDAIHSGMRMVCQGLSTFDTLNTTVAGKTGTAQQENHPNHALFVGYAPYEEPEISIAVRIAYGYTSHNAADVAKNILSCYFEEKTLDELLSSKASGSNSSASNSVTD